MSKAKNLKKQNENTDSKIKPNKITKKTKEQNEKEHQIKALIKNGLVKCPTTSKKNKKNKAKPLEESSQLTPDATEEVKPGEKACKLILHTPVVENELTNLGDKNDSVSYNKSIYIKNLPNDTKGRNVAKLLEHCGGIACITFPSNTKQRFIYKTSNTKSAYVVLKSIEGADKALKLNGTQYEGQILSVEKYYKRTSYSPELTVFVSNFKYYDNDETLHEKFSSCGDIDFIRILNKADNVGYRGKAYVSFKNADSVDLALQLDGTMLDENTINVAKYSIIKLGAPESKDQVIKVEGNENEAPEVSKDRFKEMMQQKGAKYLTNTKGDFKELMQRKGSKYLNKSLGAPKGIKVATKPNHPENNPLTTVFVGSLTNSATDEQLQNMFSSCGDISYVRTLKNPDHISCRGSAFVCFKNADAVDLALKLDGTKFDETPIKVYRYSVKKLKNIRAKYTKHFPGDGKKIKSGFRGIKSPLQLKTKNINTNGSPLQFKKKIQRAGKKYASRTIESN